MLGHGPQKACISDTSTIEVSSTTSRSHLSGLLLVAPEAAVPGIDIEQTVDGLGLAASTLAEPLGRAAGWRRQRHLDALGAEHLEDGVDQRGLAHPRTAGDDQDLREQSEPECRPLALGERDAGPGLDPGNGLCRIDVRPGKRALLKRP